MNKKGEKLNINSSACSVKNKETWERRTRVSPLSATSIRIGNGRERTKGEGECIIAEEMVNLT